MSSGSSNPELSVLRWGWKPHCCQGTCGVEIQVCASGCRAVFVGQPSSPCPVVGIPTGSMYCRAICLKDSLSHFPCWLFCFLSPCPSDSSGSCSRESSTWVLTTDYFNPQLEINILLRGKATRNERGVASEQLCLKFIITNLVFYM